MVHQATGFCMCHMIYPNGKQMIYHILTPFLELRSHTFFLLAFPSSASRYRYFYFAISRQFHSE